MNYFHLQNIEFKAIHGAYPPRIYKEYYRGATDEDVNSPSKYNELQGIKAIGTLVNTDAIPEVFRNKAFVITSVGKEFSDIHVWFDKNKCESVLVSISLLFICNISKNKIDWVYNIFVFEY